jgi:hypothetical protein
MLVPDGGSARTGGCDDRVVVREGSDMVVDKGQCLPRVPGIDVHLTAAGLVDREVDLVAESFEYGDRRLPDLRVQRIDETRREQTDSHGAFFSICLHSDESSAGLGINPLTRMMPEPRLLMR